MITLLEQPRPIGVGHGGQSMALDDLEGRMRRLEGAAAVLAMACGGAALALAFESFVVGAVAATATLGTLALRPRRPAMRTGASQVDGFDAVIAAAGLATGLLLARATGSVTSGLGVFLLAAQAIKLARPRVVTDTPVGLVIGLVLAAVATAEGVEPIFGGLLALDMAALLTATAARATAEDARGAAALVGPKAGRGTATRAGLVHAGRLVLLFAAALLLFFVAPRSGAIQFLPARRESRERTSGFSDQVGLGDIGRIQQSDAVALRIEVEQGRLPAPEDIYWRGCALDRYDGTTWTWTTSPMLGFAGLPLGSDGAGGLYDGLVRLPQGERATVVVFQEPIGARCLFTLGAVERIHFRGQRPHVVDRDALGSILCQRTATVQIAYRLEAHLGAEVPELRMTQQLEETVRRRCLRLPAGMATEPLLEYARRALAQRNVRLDAPPSKIAETLESHLAIRNSYTLDAQPTPGAEPVADFLLVRRQGHCEYFAASHVVLLRLLGIQARLVTGFRGGDRGAIGETLTVRQRNAHAWVEALVETGWRRYDPTPAAAVSRAGVLGAMGDLSDWLELRWYTWVVTLDGYDQRAMLSGMRDAVLGLVEPMYEAATASRGRITALATTVVLALLALLLGGAVWTRARRRARALAVATPALAGDGLVREALEALARRGVPRRADETLLEVSRRARAALGPEVEPLLRWAPVYHAARWGTASADPTRGPEAAALRDALRALERDRGRGPPG